MKEIGELTAKLKDLLMDFTDTEMGSGEKIVSALTKLNGASTSLGEVQQRLERKEKDVNEQLKTIGQLRADMQAAKSAFGEPTKEELLDRVKQLEGKLAGYDVLKMQNEELLRENGRTKEQLRALRVQTGRSPADDQAAAIIP